MTPDKKILILFHQDDSLALDKGFMILRMRSAWEARGIQVEVLHGIDKKPEADLVIPQIDMTIIPDSYLRFLDNYPDVVNRRVRDISKRRISQNLVHGPDDYDGPVIVKTNRNFGGLPEVHLSGSRPIPSRSSKIRRLWWRLGGRRARRSGDLASVTSLNPHQYPIFDSPKDLPSGVFENDALIVERFLPERDGDLYCLRNYVFLGDRHVCTRRTGKKPIVKGQTVVSREDVPVHDAIVAARERLGFEFGKFDYVIHDGEAVLIDVNQTPCIVDHVAAEYQRQLSILEEGIDFWLKP
jgi:hypothetical protein